MIKDEVKMVLLKKEAIDEIKNGYVHDLQLGIDLLYELDEKLVDYDYFSEVYNRIKQDTLDAKEEAIKNGLPITLFDGLQIRLLEFEFQQLLAEKATQIQHFGGIVPTVN